MARVEWRPYHRSTQNRSHGKRRIHRFRWQGHGNLSVSPSVLQYAIGIPIVQRSVPSKSISPSPLLIPSIPLNSFETPLFRSPPCLTRLEFGKILHYKKGNIHSFRAQVPFRENYMVTPSSIVSSHAASRLGGPLLIRASISGGRRDAVNGNLIVKIERGWTMDVVLSE